MKRFLPLFLISLLLTGCSGAKTNPDENFDDFYQGTGTTDVGDDSDTRADIPSTLEGGFQFSGGNDEYQCEVTCSPR